MLFDAEIDEGPLNKEDIEALKKNARERLRLWKRRALISMTAFFISCASVDPFLAGHPLYSYWETFGKYLVLLSMALLPVFVCCMGLWWGAWRALREIEK